MRNPCDRCLCLIIPSILTPLFLFIFLHYLTIPIAGYTATENFAINCGYSRSSQTLGRYWMGDIYSNFDPSEKGKQSTTSSAAEQPLESVPYSTARLSRYEFTYSFPLTAGQKYIRLHFYPSSYGEFDRSKAFFSVKIGHGYTLLSNFSAALAVDDGKETIVREFCINFNEESEKLNITFTPTAGADAYAFINGIEIVSMPDYLYYSSPQDGGFQFIGLQNSFSIKTNSALENVYRLNVGGKSLSLMDDTGMFRSWDADDDYCEKLAFVPANTNISLKFTEIPNYTAPPEVYRTARTMGNNKTENMGYNLTWVLPVDSGFGYLLRLHFCEFQPEIQEQHDRQFTIFIANQTAENHADVIAWSGGNGVPIYRDYGVLMPSLGSNQKQKLYIQLHPNLDYRTRYNDAILNGIELFKLSNSIDELAALPTSRENNKMKLVAITGGVVSGLAAVSVLCFFVVHQMKRKRDPGLRDGALWWGQVFNIWAKSSDTHRSSLTSDLCRHFSLQEIKTATKNFDKGYTVGEGGFGNVYKGYIKGGTTPVAIKRLNPESQQGAHEFMTEIEMLSKLRHIHLVSLIGYCNHKREMILVYEYMANGNLRDHLYNTDNPSLPWTQRLQICIGAARGLHYLHSGVKKTIIHRDVKTTNILLDHKWVAKVSDFGLSKMSPTSVANAHISTVVKGSFGYLDPEYFRFQRLNEKSDVYSFGVVLFEVLCARPPVNQTGEEEQAGLAHWAVTSYKNGELEEIIDPHLMGKIAPMCLEKYGEIAVSCLLDQRIKRPSMSDVVRGLELALELQESTEKGITVNESLDHEEKLSQISATTDDDDKDLFHNGGGDVCDSEASRVTIPSNDEKSSISVMMEDDACFL